MRFLFSMAVDGVQSADSGSSSINTDWKESLKDWLAEDGYTISDHKTQPALIKIINEFAEDTCIISRFLVSVTLKKEGFSLHPLRTLRSSTDDIDLTHSVHSQTPTLQVAPHR